MPSLYILPYMESEWILYLLWQKLAKIRILDERSFFTGYPLMYYHKRWTEKGKILVIVNNVNLPGARITWETNLWAVFKNRASRTEMENGARRPTINVSCTIFADWDPSQRKKETMCQAAVSTSASWLWLCDQSLRAPLAQPGCKVPLTCKAQQTLPSLRRWYQVFCCNNEIK